MCRVIAVSNQKGGVGKTVSCVNLGIGLAQEGKKVLLIDADPQGSLTISLGYEEPDEMEYSLATLMMNIVNDEKLNIEKTILHHKEGVDLIPANIELSAIEVSLVNAMSRELILRSMVDRLREFYDYIIIDCMPSLGMMTINALACADSVLIPVQAAYLPVKGLQQLIKTIGRVKKQLNPKLKIEGILLTMVDNRTNYARDISLMVYDTYSASIKVFGTEIPMSVRASEVSVEGGSIYSYDPKGKAAFAYMALTKEVLKELDRISRETVNAEKFLALVKKYTDFSELTPAMINEFVEKILVHQAEGKGASRTQEVEIFFNFIGKVEIPRKEIELTEEEKAALAEKMLRQKLSKEERRTRSHRLIVRGAVFESIVPEAKNMTDEEAAALLRLALTSEPAREYLKKRAESRNAE